MQVSLVYSSILLYQVSITPCSFLIGSHHSDISFSGIKIGPSTWSTGCLPSLQMEGSRVVHNGMSHSLGRSGLSHAIKSSKRRLGGGGGEEKWQVAKSA